MLWKSPKDDPAQDAKVPAADTSPEESRREPEAPPENIESVPELYPAASGDVDDSDLEQMIVDALRTVYDPEIPVNIYDIGLVYDININDARDVHIRMTLTSPNCPEAEIIPIKVERAVAGVPGTSGVKVDIVWDPPWTPDLLSEAARLELGMI